MSEAGKEEKMAHGKCKGLACSLASLDASAGI